MLSWIVDRDELERVAGEHGDYFVILFYGRFSEPAGRALEELKAFGREYGDIPLYALDVEKVKGVHKEYGVTGVPTVVVVKDGEVADRFPGVESAAFYATQLCGMAPAHVAVPARKKAPRVTVYTSPGCAPCGMVKTYLRQNGISFRAVDISRDERAARDIVKRSGQQAVPQIDINGRIVVGFDKAKLNALLGITAERSET